MIYDYPQNIETDGETSGASRVGLAASSVELGDPLGEQRIS